jgi:hypothetical protein
MTNLVLFCNNFVKMKIQSTRIKSKLYVNIVNNKKQSSVVIIVINLFIVNHALRKFIQVKNLNFIKP